MLEVDREAAEEGLELISFAGREAVEQPTFVVQMDRNHAIDQVEAIVGEPDQLAPAVVRRILAHHEPVPFEAVETFGDPARGHQQRPAQVDGAAAVRRPESAQRSENVEVPVRQAQLLERRPQLLVEELTQARYPAHH